MEDPESFSQDLRLKGASLLVVLFLSSACSLSRYNAKDDPFYKTFFEKAQLIMLDAEKKVYRQLLEIEEKRQFIDEFWRIRDPDPGTPVNENKQEFEDRIEYANIWFGTFNPLRGKEAVPDRETANGWNSERGRIYIILGPPDELIYDNGNFMLDGRRLSRSQGEYSEIWYYYHYDLAVYFQKSRIGRWSLSGPDASLFNALERAKQNWIGEGYRMDTPKSFEFSVSYETDHLLIRIPVENISFADKEGKLLSEIKIKVEVYLGQTGLETLEDTHRFMASEEELFDLDEVLVPFPYSLPRKGDYLFDVVLEDTLAMGYSKSRATCKASRKTP